jgi:hypothetical protein
MCPSFFAPETCLLEGSPHYPLQARHVKCGFNATYRRSMNREGQGKYLLFVDKPTLA